MPKRSIVEGAAFRRSAPVALAALVASVWSVPVDAQVARPRSARLPLTFEANAGQTHRDVKFLSRAPGYVLFLTETEAVVASEASALRMRWVGGTARAAVEGRKTLAARSHYYRGADRRRWIESVPHYGQVQYSDVYPGIDLVYYGTDEGQVEFDFVVASGADPASIALQFDGADHLAVQDSGDLIIRTRSAAGGTVTLHRPAIYQEHDGMRRAVAGGYVLHGGGRVGFELGAYDRSRPLTIDPVLTLNYSTFLGGSGSDKALALAVDAAGQAIVTGNTSSVDFPTVNAAQATAPGADDHFVAKLSADGSSLIYATYLGGSKGEGTNQGAVALDAAGNAYVAGSTFSGNFPTTAGSYRSTLNAVPNDDFASFDGYIVKLSPAGALVYSTFLGGSHFDSINAIDVDGSGNAYVTGGTQSSDFPLEGALQTTQDDSFVAKLNAAGSALVYSTYFGGNNFDVTTGIAVDSSGSAYLTGMTGSSNFPTVNPVQPALDPAECFPGRPCGDAFLTKINPAGSAYAYSTYLGGSGQDRGTDVEVDAFGVAHVAGDTNSTNFPTAAPLQAVRAGAEDAFLAKFSASGSSLDYSSYLGGSGREGTGFSNESIVGISLAVDGAGDTYLAGVTASSDFPSLDAMQGFVAGGPSDVQAFLTKLHASGSALTYSTAINPPQQMAGEVDVAIDLLGNAYVAGGVGQAGLLGGYPTTANAVQPVHGGGNLDAFLAKLSHFVSVAIDIKPGSTPNTINLGSGGVVAVAILSTATFDATTVDPLTVTLASAPVKLKGNGTPQVIFRDVDGDGRQDIVVHIATEALQLNPNDTVAVLEGETFGGSAIVGTDLVRIVP